MSGGLLSDAFVYLLAAVVAVPIAKRLGLGSVLGYLFAGVVIGPMLGLVGSETREVQHFAEFGVVIMLFIVGLELDPKSLWEMRQRLAGLGGLQVLGSTAAVAAIAWLAGQPWQIALAIGLILSLSSTAIVLQTLEEKGLTRSDGGRASFAVLLAQDIAVIPILAFLPLLAVPELLDVVAGAGGDGAETGASGAAGGHGASDGGGDDGASTADDGHGGEGSGGNPMSGFAAWQVALFNLGAIAAVVFGGHYFTRPVLRYVAGTGLREIFTATALLLVIGIALLMQLVGLSPALGTFLAGVVLANSEYRHELESDIEPFRGLLLGLFFITVGAGIDFVLLLDSLATVLALTLGVVAVKAGILYLLGILFGLRGAERWLLALSLAQAGEFGFVLLSFAVQNTVLPREIADLLLLVVALSMMLTPALFVLFERVIAPKFSRGQTQADDEITRQGTTIIAGHGRFGQVVNRLLLSNGCSTVVLDHRAELIEGLRRFGTEVFYGDATRPDLLLAAGLDDARLLVVAIDDEDEALELIAFAKRRRPDLHVIARAFDRRHVYRLYQSGADDIVREVFDSSVRAGRYALEALGTHPYEAEKACRLLVRQDNKALRRLAEVWRADVAIFENEEYVSLAREIRGELDRAMQSDRASRHDRSAEGWVPPGNTDTGDGEGRGED